MLYKEYILNCFEYNNNEFKNSLKNNVNDSSHIFWDILSFVEEPKINIYIIGRYNTGKTTFINNMEKIQSELNINYIEKDIYSSDYNFKENKPHLFIFICTSNTMEYLATLERHMELKRKIKNIPYLFIQNKVDNDFIRDFPNYHTGCYDISSKYNYGLKEIFDLIYKLI